ncbi:hypothetical protein M1O20_05360 [Dehalococcoidia bacterium]|nr:hypothetical protein [Dehalococcoidia bacterium]
MKKWWLVISLVLVIAMLGAGALAAFYGNQQVADYGYGIDLAAMMDGHITDGFEKEFEPLYWWRIAEDRHGGWMATIVEWVATIEEMTPNEVRKACSLRLPWLRDFRMRPDEVRERFGELFPGVDMWSMTAREFSDFIQSLPCLPPPPCRPLCLEEVKHNRNIIEAFGRVPQLSTQQELDEFNQKLEKVLSELAPLLWELRLCRAPRRFRLVRSLGVFGGAITIELDHFYFPRAEQVYGWIDERAESLFGIEEVPVIFCSSSRPGPGCPRRPPTWDELVNALPHLVAKSEAYEKLADALPHLTAQGVPVVDFVLGFGAPDPRISITRVVLVTVALREVKEEYKESIRAIVEGVEGIEFDFFQAEFTREEIWGWQNKIWETFSRPWDLPPGIIEVPVSGTFSSWRGQRITVRIAGRVKPEYIEAIRVLVGHEAPLYFQGGGSRPHHTRYWREQQIPDEAREMHDIFVHVSQELFPDVDLLNMRIGEVEEFIKGLNVEEATELMRMVIDYALEQGLVAPQEQQELEEKMLQEWLERRQE